MRKHYKKRINVDQRKYVSTGFMGISQKTGKEVPKKTNHFVFFNPDTGEEYYPELREFYGDECKEIFIMFPPTDTYADFFSDDYNKWTSTHNLRRRCDGETCLHVIDDNIEVDGKKITYKAGTETECICKFHGWKDENGRILEKFKDNACGCDLFLKAYILNPKNSKIISPNCYLFYSGSENNADNVRSQLEQFKRFAGIPFKISLKEVKRNNISYYLWNFIPHLTPQQLIEHQYTNTAITDGQNLYMLNESVHTEQKENYDPETSGSSEPPPNNKTTNERQNNEEPVSDELKFKEEKQWTIREFSEKFSTGEIEGEENIRQITDNILSSSPTLEDFEARGNLMLAISGLSAEIKDVIITVAKAVRHRKGWEKKK